MQLVEDGPLKPGPLGPSTAMSPAGPAVTINTGLCGNKRRVVDVSPPTVGSMTQIIRPHMSANTITGLASLFSPPSPREPPSSACAGLAHATQDHQRQNRVVLTVVGHDAEAGEESKVRPQQLQPAADAHYQYSIQSFTGQQGHDFRNPLSAWPLSDSSASELPM